MLSLSALKCDINQFVTNSPKVGVLQYFLVRECVSSNRVSSLCTYPVISAHFLYSDFVLLTTSVITFIRITEEGDPLEGHLYAGSNHVQIFP